MQIALIGFFVTRLLPCLEKIIEDQVFVSLVSAAFGFAAGLQAAGATKKRSPTVRSSYYVVKAAPKTMFCQ